MLIPPFFLRASRPFLSFNLIRISALVTPSAGIDSGFRETHRLFGRTAGYKDLYRI